MSPKFLCAFLVSLAASVSLSDLAAQGTDDKPIVSLSAKAQNGPVPNAPECFAVARRRLGPRLARLFRRDRCPLQRHVETGFVGTLVGYLERSGLSPRKDA